MVLCKYFLQGSCRLGENCKFEHQYPDGQQQHASIIRHQNFNPTAINPTSPTSAVDPGSLIRSVATDMNAVEKSGQWLLSCYAPFKEKAAFPGFEDHSFEEIRYGYYNAKNNGTVEAYCQQLNALLQQAVMRVRALQNPSQEAVAVIRQIFDEQPQSPNNAFISSSNSIFGNTQANVFGNMAANTNTFRQPTNIGTASIFNQNTPPQNSSAQSIFAAANKTFIGTQQSIFSTANQNVFGHTQTPLVNTPFAQSNLVENPSGFQPPQTTFNNDQLFTRSGFINTPFSNSNPNTLPFVPTTQNNSSFITPQPQLGSSIFNSQASSNSPLVAQKINNNFNAQTAQNTPFNNASSNFSITQQTQILNKQQPLTVPQSTGIFNSNITPAPLSVYPLGNIDESVYSKQEELSESDLKSYQADAFEFGKVPEKPPHISMC